MCDNKKVCKKIKKQKNNGNEVINFAAKLAFVCMFVWVCVCVHLNPFSAFAIWWVIKFVVSLSFYEKVIL